MSSNSLTGRRHSQKSRRASNSSKVHNIPQASEISLSLPRSPTIRSRSIQTRPIQSYKDEMVASFFTAMLVQIIDKKEIFEEPIVESNVHVSDTTVTAKDFKDLIDNDLIQQEVVSVDGSQVSLGSRSKKMASKRNSQQSKRHSQNQGSIKSSHGSLGKKRKSAKSSSDMLPIISESVNAKNSSDLCLEVQMDSWRVKDSNEIVVITFRNGNVFEGPLRNQLFHGQGAFYWNDGTVYFGNFENGEITGLGKMIYTDMSVYHGKFFNGKPHGIGAFYMGYTRTLYNGNWVHGKKEGQGWLYYSENNWYDGEWHNDYRAGFGTRLYKNNTKYSGMWIQGIRNGQGDCSFINGDFYRGEWYDGELHGYGEYTWRAFFNKSLTFPVENIYQGSWTNGMRNGFGHLYFGLEHGARLVGFWQMNLKHGLGIVINCNGDVTERDPLFYNDKPAHISTTDDHSRNESQTYKNTPSTQFPSLHSLMNLPASHQKWLLKSPVQNTRCVTPPTEVSEMIVGETLAKQSIKSEIKPNIYSWSKANARAEQVVNVQNIDSLQDFPKERLLCNPLILHTRAAPESLNLNFYIKKHIAEAKDQLSMSMSISSSTGNDSKKLEVVENDTMEHESNSLRNLIWHNTKYLQTIYEMYANISNHPDEPNRKCILIRLYLWQLYRDLKIYRQGISLFETDLILLENPGHCLGTDHHPFERIYYWQFLWSLIGVAWQIHINDNKIGPFKLHSVYAVFEYFLKNILYRYAGQHIGPCLFEFKNLLSVRDVIAFYEDIGPVLTAREFLNKCCCKKSTEPSCHLQNFGDNYVVPSEYGRNIIAVGRNFLYLPDEKDTIMPNLKLDPYPLEIDKFFKTLKVFRHIGPQRMVNCLTLACPIIKKDGLIVNMAVKLTFLEFYETLIYCAYKSILLVNLKERSNHYVLDESRSRSEKYDKRKKSRKDPRKRKK